MLSSPVVYLFDTSGNPLEVTPDNTIPANTKAILVSGSDGTNSRLMYIDSAGKVGVTDSNAANRFAGGKNTSALTISSSGNNTVYTPASGKTLTLHWLGMSSSQNNGASVVATVKLGSKVCYIFDMGTPGAFSHWEPITANNPDDALIVSLSAGQSVNVNYTTTEI